jgi:tetratricopeptide (TPR) repeat protein
VKALARRLAACLVALACAAPALARADGARPAKVDPSSPVEQRRTQLYREAVSLSDRGKWQEAADKLREVVALRSAPRALIAYGIALENLTRLAEARGLYERAARDAQADGLGDDAREASGLSAQLAPRVPRVSLQADGAPAPRVLVDGAPAALEAGVIYADPGHHVIRVEADGARPVEVTVRLAEGDRKTLVVSLEPLVASRGAPTASWVLGGVGLATLAPAFVFWGLGRAEASDLEDACGGELAACPASRDDEVDAARRKTTTGIVLFGAAGAAVAAGAIVWAIAPSSDAPEATALTLAPLEGGAWAGVRGRF